MRNLASVLLVLLCAASAAAQKPKVIVDQDARGPASTDMQSILMFLQSPDVDVLGITLVCGDQFIKEQTARTLRAVEIAGRTDVPVVPGAEHPLINSKEESELWEAQYGEFGFKGAWTPRFYHDPDVMPELEEGQPTTKPLDEHAANFIVRMVRQYPGEVTLWAGGPLTNIALAIALDPEVPKLAKELVLMGAGFNVGMGGIHRINGRREFNWWFDPEAVRIVMSAPWKKITITPVDISVKTRLSDDIRAEIAKADTPLARYHTRFARPSYMWDEISVAAFLDPSIITESKELQVNIDIDHGASYGQTIFVEKEVKAPDWFWQTAVVQFDLDLDKFYRMYIDLMSRPPQQVAARAPGASSSAASKANGPTSAPASGKRKVFIDQDAHFPTGTDTQSILALLQAPDVEVLGIAITSGDGWAKAGAQVVLRMLELTGHDHVPVAEGAWFPLINTRERTALWEAQWGEFAYKGIWLDRIYHDPAAVPPSTIGAPTTKPIPMHGANFLIETLRQHPGEVTVWAGGPLTTIALAIRLDPEVPKLAKELVLMGAGFNVGEGGNHRINGRREFNWWFDPEAARITMSASWKRITITPVDISVKTRLSEEIKTEVARSDSPVAQYLTKNWTRFGFYMWDEIAALAFIDPTLITEQQELQVNIDIDHGAGYGQTIFIEKEVKAPDWFWQPATVQWNLDTERFYRLFIDLMSRHPAEP
ncbi:MAG: nucleoside hydrolase [Gemmataceae bacterium]|nr:nucleoside hydrolase [Gemmataceae bacterium]